MILLTQRPSCPLKGARSFAGLPVGLRAHRKAVFKSPIYVTLSSALYHQIDRQNMLSPGFVFSFILATLFGATFHLIFGGDARRLALFLLVGWLGFALGHITGLLFEIDLFNIGSLRVVTAAAGAVLALMLAQILSSGRSRRRSPR